MKDSDLEIRLNHTVHKKLTKELRKIRGVKTEKKLQAKTFFGMPVIIDEAVPSDTILIVPARNALIMPATQEAQKERLKAFLKHAAIVRNVRCQDNI
jgi:hypothetical protein